MDHSQDFKSLLDSKFGKELIRTLEEDLKKSLLEKAEDADSMEKAYGFTKEASGVTKVIEHLQFRAVTPKDKGGKG